MLRKLERETDSDTFIIHPDLDVVHQILSQYLAIEKVHYHAKWTVNQIKNEFNHYNNNNKKNQHF